MYGIHTGFDGKQGKYCDLAHAKMQILINSAWSPKKEQKRKSQQEYRSRTQSRENNRNNYRTRTNSRENNQRYQGARTYTSEMTPKTEERQEDETRKQQSEN